MEDVNSFKPKFIVCESDKYAQSYVCIGFGQKGTYIYPTYEFAGSGQLHISRRGPLFLHLVAQRGRDPWTMARADRPFGPSGRAGCARPSGLRLVLGRASERTVVGFGPCVSERAVRTPSWCDTNFLTGDMQLTKINFTFPSSQLKFESHATHHDLRLTSCN